MSLAKRKPTIWNIQVSASVRFAESGGLAEARVSIPVPQSMLTPDLIELLIATGMASIPMEGPGEWE